MKHRIFTVFQQKSYRVNPPLRERCASRLVRRGVSPRITIHHRAMNLITAAEAHTSQENNWYPETFSSGLLASDQNRCQARRITPYKPTSQELATIVPNKEESRVLDENLNREKVRA
jgi:hypothetical protein